MTIRSILRTVLSIASFTLSGVAFCCGIYLVFTDIPLIGALIPLSYSVATTTLLIVAWKTGAPGYSSVSFLLAFVLSLFMIIGSMDSGSISDLEWLLIAAIFPVFSLNWLAVKGAVEYNKQKRDQYPYQEK